MDPNHGRQRCSADNLPGARLRPPAVHALRRERLLDALLGAPHRLVLVTGPAGCGKTTLLMQLVQAVPEARPVAWYQLDGADAQVPVLLGHLAHALGVAVGGARRTWDTVEQVVADLEEVEAGEAGDDGDVLLALDDLHVIAGTAAEEALGQVLDLAPPWLRVAAAGRQPPRWNLSRLRVSGALFEIGADALRFRSWEVERLFTELYREPLPPGDLAQLTRGLEGWAAGLQLFHLATRGKPVVDRRRAVAALPARSKLVREYLTGNVLDELPQELRAFLLETSVCGRLSPALGDALRGRDDSGRLLGELEARQLFVERIDEDGTYRYHEVFRTYLEGRLVERDGRSGARVWSRRAAELLEADGRMVEALRAYCRAEDWPSVGRVLETAGRELAQGSAAWLDLLPPGLLEDDPWAMLAAARQAASTGRFARALDLYARAELVPGSTRAAEVCKRERAALAGWVDPSAPPPEGWPGRLLAAFRSHPVRFVAPAPEVDVEGRHAGQALAAGVAAVLAGDTRTVARWLSAAVDDPGADVTVAAAARVTLAVAGVLGGGVTRAAEGEIAPGPDGGAHVDELPELVELAEQPWLTWLARAARGLDGSAEGWCQAHEVADVLDQQGDPWGSAAARFLAVLGAIAAGGSPVGALDDLCRRLRALDAAVLECWCRAWRATALARLACGGVGRAAGGPVTPAAAVTAAAASSEAADVVAAAERLGVPGAQVWALTVQAQLAERAGAVERAEALLGQVAAIRRRGVDIVVPPLGGARPAGGGRVGPGSAAPVRLRCLGGFRIEIGGRPVDLTSAKPRVRATLRLLAARAGQPVHVETLVEALWPDGGAAAGKRSLQVALSSLRRLFDEHGAARALIVRDGDAYLLALPAGAEADVVDFGAARDECRAAARRGDAEAVVTAGERALHLYAGELLPEEGPAEWVVQPRRNLAQDATEIALLLAEHALGLDRGEVAVAACRRGLHVDRYSDALWRLLIVAHQRRGDRAAAARTRERYQAMLRDLGLPGPVQAP